jgi:hypothetical protein
VFQVEKVNTCSSGLPRVDFFHLNPLEAVLRLHGTLVEHCHQALLVEHLSCGRIIICLGRPHGELVVKPLCVSIPIWPKLRAQRVTATIQDYLGVASCCAAGAARFLGRNTRWAATPVQKGGGLAADYPDYPD